MVRRIERIIRPGRLKALTGPALPYVLALPVFALAIEIALPIPFGSILPVIAVCVIAIGLIERDGLIVLLGTSLTLFALVVTAHLSTALHSSCPRFDARPPSVSPFTLVFVGAAAPSDLSVRVLVALRSQR